MHRLELEHHTTSNLEVEDMCNVRQNRGIRIGADYNDAQIFHEETYVSSRM